MILKLDALVSYFTLEYSHYLFTDIVSGKPVSLYVDKDGKKWMKDSRWSLFRVEHLPTYSVDTEVKQ